jgi:hypothetical protein
MIATIVLILLSFFSGFHIGKKQREKAEKAKRSKVVLNNGVEYKSAVGK